MASSSTVTPGGTGDCKLCWWLSQAINNNEVELVTNFLNQQQNATIDAFERAVKKACSCGQLEIVRNIISPRQGLQMVDPLVINRIDSYCKILELDIAVGNGNYKKVKYLCGNNQGLLGQANSGGYGLAIPVVRASNAGHREITHYLYKKTCNDPTNVLFHDGDGFWTICLLLDAIFYGFLGIYWMTLRGLPKWFGIKKIHDLKDRHSKAQYLLKSVCEVTKDMDKDQNWKETVYKALFEAVENGNKEFFINIIKCNPQLLWISQATSGRNLFHLAVEHKKEKIFNLIHGLDEWKATLLRSHDNKGNNILHIASHLSTQKQLSRVSGSALKMQREAQWFNQVKSLVSEREVVQKNDDNMTPRRVFEDSHECLRKEGEEWMKYTATACSLVAALIATVTFQAIFTVPGGTNENTGNPLLLQDSHFMAFVVIDALAFFASCISLLVFLSILTSRYSFDDFVVSLPRKMIFGLTILFFSIASMLVAFITALSSSMHERPILVVPIKPLAAIPSVLFLMLQYPLLKEMISSTYCKGIFSQDNTKWF